MDQNKNIRVVINNEYKPSSEEIKNAKIQRNIGDTYYKANRIDDAIDCYKKATIILKGDTEALYKIGKCYEKKENLIEAVKWYSKAAEQGNVEGQLKLGRLYHFGKNTVDKNPRMSATWYFKAASLKNISAQLMQVFYYYYGFGVSQKKGKAKQLYLEEFKGITLSELTRIFENEYEECLEKQRAEKDGDKFSKMIAEFGNTNNQLKFGELYEGEKDIIEALKWYSMAAEQGNVEVQLKLGKFYEENNFYVEAVGWYSMVADQGNVEVQLKLGRWYHLGKETLGEDPDMSATWYSKAAKLNNRSAKLMLMFFYYSGFGVPQDTEEARQLYRKEFEESSLSELKNMFLEEYSGFGDKQRCETDVFRFSKMLAELGNIRVQMMLGKHYVEKNDLDEAVKWYSMAAEQEDVPAQLTLGKIYEENNNTNEAVEWYRKAAKKGSVQALLNLGVLFEKKKNTSEAVKWYSIVAEQGNVEVQLKLGKIYEENNNIIEALEWYRKAARRGSVQAQLNLGEYYEKNKNLSEAVIWYRKAAIKGSVGAQLRLGDILCSNENEDRDPSEAVDWYKFAANKDSVEACIRLADCFSQGLGVDQNLKEAARWREKADSIRNRIVYSDINPGSERKIVRFSDGKEFGIGY